jgi:hypothetical protein
MKNFAEAIAILVKVVAENAVELIFILVILGLMASLIISTLRGQ